MTCATVSLFPSSTVLNQNIFLEGVLQGQVSYQSPIYVELQDGVGVPITPTSSTLVGNTLTATLATPNPNGVALQFPKGSIRTSYYNYDSGWRTQNNVYNYTPPVYPAKIAKLNYSAGANWWYTLQTPLTVNGVTSTQRFVDLSGIQLFSPVNNLNYCVLDKLTGLMISRVPFNISAGAANYATFLNNQFALSVTINGNTYSTWFAMGVNEWNAVFGNVCPAGNWIDPTSGLSIFPNGVTSRLQLSQNYNGSPFDWQGVVGVANENAFISYNINTAFQMYTFRDGSSLIS